MSATWAHRAFAVAAALGFGLVVVAALSRIAGEALSFDGAKLGRALSLLPLVLALGLVAPKLARRRRGRAPGARDSRGHGATRP